jgi:TRAP-type uncharacterized transport system substrate-binding protein
LFSCNTQKRFDNGHSKAKDIQLKSALNAVNTPLQPGAEKFYKEKGVTK